jgi:hypothetical protein
MIKQITILFCYLSFNLYAQEFVGCGEYNLKGVLKKDENAPLKLSYLVHAGTNSQMRFHLTEPEDVLKLALMLDIDSSIKAKILKPMDGTKGKISGILEISKRFPNPISSSDTGINLILKLNCIEP